MTRRDLLGALTVTALKHLGDDADAIDADGQLQTWRVVRVDDAALIDMPANDRSPRCINCYSVEAERFDGTDGHKFKLDPHHLVYSPRWKHNAHPPDFHLALVQEDAEEWVNAACLTLLSVLRREAPHSIDWNAMGDVLSVLDAFEAAMEGKIARRR